MLDCALCIRTGGTLGDNGNCHFFVESIGNRDSFLYSLPFASVLGFRVSGLGGSTSKLVLWMFGSVEGTWQSSFYGPNQ